MRTATCRGICETAQKTFPHETTSSLFFFLVPTLCGPPTKNPPTYPDNYGLSTNIQFNKTTSSSSRLAMCLEIFHSVSFMAVSSFSIFLPGSSSAFDVISFFFSGWLSAALRLCRLLFIHIINGFVLGYEINWVHSVWPHKIFLKFLITFILEWIYLKVLKLIRLWKRWIGFNLH